MENIAFTAPVGGDSKRIDDVELIPTGMHLCTFYGLADLGTQDSHKFGPKHKCQLAFEFPQELRQFYEGDAMKPCAIFTDETLSMAPKANLRKNYVENMVGRKLTDEEAGKFNLSGLLGQHYVATISHSPDGKWANISSITPLSEKNRMMFGLTENKVAQINETFFFHPSQGFMSEAFKNLPKFVREKIKGSAEAEAHVRAGGKFLEPDPADFKKNGSNGGVKKLVMKPNAEFTYEQYKAADWTDQMLVDNGKAEWVAPVAPPSPQALPAAPGAPPSQSSPVAPTTPTTPPAAPVAPPTAPEKKLVIKNGTALEEWTKSGWTVEMMVKEGHASFQ